VQQVEFHPSSNLVLTAGLDKTLRLFQADGKINPKIQGVHFDDLPLLSAHFTRDGTEVIVTGQRRHFYSYDIAAGRITKVQQIFGQEDKKISSLLVSPDNATLAVLSKQGKVSLLSRRTKQKMGELQMGQGDLRDAAFSKDGGRMFTVTSNGLVSEWDVASRRVIRLLRDTASFHISKLALSPDDHYLALGSQSGVVQIYDLASTPHIAQSGPGATCAISARHEIPNLTTRTDTLKFCPDGQVLAVGSKAKKDAFRLVHVPSFTTFSNWPTAKTPLHYVTSIDFSRDSGLLTIGNDRGRALLYRLKHYTS